MNITVLPLGPMQANCYIVSEGDACAIIDPGAQGEKLIGWLKEQNLTPGAVFLTHGHFDHVGAVKVVAKEYGCPVYLHPGDTSMEGYLAKGLWWNKTYEEGDVIAVGSMAFAVLHTPGHTPGSVCLKIGDTLLSGDTLFAENCGRTDFPGGSWEEMLASLRRLAALEDCTVLPGHGGETTIAWERVHNPYMKEATT